MTDIIPEFSRILSVSRLSPNGVEEKLEARPDERAALAKRFELLDLITLKAQLTVTPDRRQSVAVAGSITADIVQQCVVTLEPITTHMDLAVDITFVPEDRHQEGSGSPYPDALDDEIEIFADGKIDLGEMVAQHLGAHIDLYPRKPDAELTTTEFGAKIKKTHPFEQLAAIKPTHNKGTND